MEYKEIKKEIKDCQIHSVFYIIMTTIFTLLSFHNNIFLSLQIFSGVIAICFILVLQSYKLLLEIRSNK